MVSTEALLSRFGDLAGAAAPSPSLAEAALVAAAVIGHPAPLDDGIARIQALAEGVDGDDLDAVTAFLSGTAGFCGDQRTYDDPANSMLPSVLDRRRGIPVTLAILTVDVARRRGLAAEVVAMPGHVLVGDGAVPGRWWDGFHGIWLDSAGARARFASIHGRHAPFDQRHLNPTPAPLVLARLLGNLIVRYGQTGQARELVRALRLRSTIAGFDAHDRAALAQALESVGRLSEAADLWLAAADAAVGDAAGEVAAANVRRLRERLN